MTSWVFMGTPKALMLLARTTRWMPRSPASASTVNVEVTLEVKTSLGVPSEGCGIAARCTIASASRAARATTSDERASPISTRSADVGPSNSRERAVTPNPERTRRSVTARPISPSAPVTNTRVMASFLVE